jgi:hypothetical protein
MVHRFMQTLDWGASSSSSSSSSFSSLKKLANPMNFWQYSSFATVHTSDQPSEMCKCSAHEEKEEQLEFIVLTTSRKKNVFYSNIWHSGNSRAASRIMMLLLKEMLTKKNRFYLTKNLGNFVSVFCYHPCSLSFEALPA